MRKIYIQKTDLKKYVQRLIYQGHRVPRHIWGHGFVKVGDTDLKRRFQVSWCEIINYSISTII
jgi:hypothetical protein